MIYACFVVCSAWNQGKLHGVNGQGREQLGKTNVLWCEMFALQVAIVIL